MSLIGNLLWLVLGGIIVAILWALAGLILCITVVGIPFGLQCFKIAGLVLCPFGKDVDVGNFGLFGGIGNIIWILVLGWELFLAHLVFAGICAISIVGIPFAVQHLKLAKLALVPFGTNID
ncbi:YccF domain-containing protein [Wukongibacter baidiensis]|uniref:YccF domain-containing protein n=1 Tax=Wukongibacter baidiensis TaxID=1723361 RepID=UPI003D7F6735